MKFQPFARRFVGSNEHLGTLLSLLINFFGGITLVLKNILQIHSNTMISVIDEWYHPYLNNCGTCFNSEIQDRLPIVSAIHV